MVSMKTLAALLCLCLPILSRAAIETVPLKEGNTWKYRVRHHIFTRTSIEPDVESVQTIRIDSIRPEGMGSLVYVTVEGGVAGSGSNRYTLEESERGFSSLNSGAWSTLAYFYKEGVSADSVISVFAAGTGYNLFKLRNRTWPSMVAARGIGVISHWNGFLSSMTGSGFSTQSDLIEFNGKQVDFTPVMDEFHFEYAVLGRVPGNLVPWKVVAGITSHAITSLFEAGSGKIAESVIYGSIMRSLVVLSNGSWSSLQFEPGDTLVYGLAQAEGRLFATTEAGIHASDDGGLSWKRVSELKAQSIYAKKYLVVADVPGIGLALSIDRGRTWKVGAVPDPLGSKSPLLYFDFSEDILRIGTYNNLIFETRDLGKTWQSRVLPRAIVRRIQAAGNLVIAGYHQGIMRSLDGGLSWDTILVVEREPLGDLLLNGDRLFAATSRGVLASLDSGRTWLSLHNGLKEPGITALSLIGDTLFCATHKNLYGLPFHGMALGVRRQVEPAIHHEFRIFSQTIEFNNDSSDPLIKVEITNLEGRTIGTARLAGSRMVLDLRGIGPGTYLVRVRLRNGVACKAIQVASVP